jgi:hypothetical protein
LALVAGWQVLSLCVCHLLVHAVACAAAPSAPACCGSESFAVSECVLPAGGGRGGKARSGVGAPPSALFFDFLCWKCLSVVVQRTLRNILGPLWAGSCWGKNQLRNHPRQPMGTCPRGLPGDACQRTHTKKTTVFEKGAFSGAKHEPMCVLALVMCVLCFLRRARDAAWPVKQAHYRKPRLHHAPLHAPPHRLAARLTLQASILFILYPLVHTPVWWDDAGRASGRARDLWRGGSMAFGWCWTV